MSTSGKKVKFVLGLAAALSLLSGCVGTPIYRLWHRSEWLEDEKYARTLHTRLEELAVLRAAAADLDAAGQERLARELTQALANDSVAAYRREVVRTLGVLTAPAAAEGLRAALQDKDASVRIAACSAWGERGGSEAVSTLSETLEKDADLDVRLAAARELARFRDPSVVAALGQALDAPDPALQYRAVESLEEITGEDFGNSIPAWRQYVRDGTVHPENEPTLAERFRELF